MSRRLRALRIVRSALAWLMLAIGAFMAVAWIGSSIPRNADWQEPAEGVQILVGTNGVHTELILPATTREADWTARFPPGDTRAPLRPYTHVAISWGEREGFLNTPEWKDLSPLTVLRILGFGGEGLMHVAWYVRPAPSQDYRPMRITREEYAALVQAIERHIPRGPLPAHPGYYDNDVFYETGGRYTFRRTCNQWTSDALAEAGIKTGWWTPFAGGVMKWVPELKSRAAGTSAIPAR